MRADGSRDFAVGEGREPPIVGPARPGDRTIFLADYDGPLEAADTVRMHPSREAPAETLAEALGRHDIAIGYRTTALVTAALMGLNVVCRWPGHILARPDWLDVLPYADWHRSEIASGECWAHLMESMPCAQAA